MTWVEDPFDAALAEERQRCSFRHFAVVVRGCPYTFHSGDLDPGIALPDDVFDATGPIINRTPIRCFTRSADIAWHVEDAGEGPGARVVFSQMELVLNAIHGQPIDLVGYFDRIDRSEATWWAAVVATTDATDPCEILVARDPSGLPADPITGAVWPRFLYVGRQVVRATGWAAAGSAWKLTGCTRTAGGSIPQSINASAISGRTPVITTEPISWDRRIATLYYRRHPGDIWRALVPGRLHGEPHIEGSTIVLTLNPLPNCVDEVLAPASLATELVTTHHLFQRRGCRVEHIQHIPRGVAFSEKIDEPRGQNTGQWPSNEAPAAHTASFDFNLGGGHPRSGPVVGNNGNNTPALVTGYATNAADGWDGLLTSTGPESPNGVQIGDFVSNAEVAEVIQAIIAPDDAADPDALVAWPGGLFEAINSATGWNRPQHTGDDGAWVALTAHIGPADGEGVAHLSARKNTPVGRNVSIHRYRVNPPTRRGERGVPIRDPDARVWSRDAGGGWQAQRSSYTALLPAEVWSPMLDGAAPRISVPGGSPTAVFNDVPLPARAFLIPGELKFITTSPLPVPPGGHLTVRFVAGEVTAEGRVIAVAEQLDGGGAHVGWVHTLDPIHRTQQQIPLLIQAADGDPISVTPVIRAVGNSSGLLMLQLLCSVEGSGANGQFDTLIAGCGIPEAVIDTASFVAIGDPQAVEWRPIFAEGTSILEFFRIVGLLTNSVVTLVPHADGRCLLTRVSVAPALAPPDLGALAVAEMPSASASRTVRNVIEWQANPDPEGKPTFAWTSRDLASIAEHGPRRPLEVELPGYIPTDPSGRLAALRSLEIRVFARYGRRRRAWAIMTPSDAGLRAVAFAAFAITSGLLRDPGRDRVLDLMGVDDIPARVVRAEVALHGEGARLEVEPAFNRGMGWNISGLVVGIDAEVHEDVDTGTYPDAETVELHPTADSGGPHDAANFAAGDIVYFAPAGDSDAGVERVVIGVHVNADRITVDGASGLGSPDYGDVWPVDYDRASTVRRNGLVPQALAFFADGNGKLGAADDPGREVL